MKFSIGNDGRNRPDYTTSLKKRDLVFFINVFSFDFISLILFFGITTNDKN
ncbi:hypothetical protein [Epilithonimonas sp.]|uniref:hypothetical protein n=1 Tax=Epilithonimonas sp. TaxID=2894511 RepID=UPI002FDD2BCC